MFVPPVQPDYTKKGNLCEPLNYVKNRIAHREKRMVGEGPDKQEAGGMDLGAETERSHGAWSRGQNNWRKCMGIENSYKSITY